eukprot:7187780-Prymnesium_polylepis.1
MAYSHTAKDAFFDVDRWWQLPPTSAAASPTASLPKKNTSKKPFDIDSVIASTRNLHTTTTTLAPTPKCDDTFSSHSLMVCPGFTNHGLSEDRLRLLANHRLRVNVDICSPCAFYGKLCKCIVNFDKSFGYCDYSGAQLFQATEADTSLMSFRPLIVEPNIFAKTAMETVISRKGFQTLPCGYCGDTTNESAQHEIVDLGQIVRALFYRHGNLTWEKANDWVRNVLTSLSNAQRLPLRCCTKCANNGLHLRSTCFAAYAILRKPNPRKKDTERDVKTQKNFEEGHMALDAYSSYHNSKSERDCKRMAVYLARREVARGIAAHYASGLSSASSISTEADPGMDYEKQSEAEKEEEDADLFEDGPDQSSAVVSVASGEEKPIAEDTFYLPTYLSQ